MTTLRLIAILCLVLFLSAISGSASDDQVMQARIYIDSKADWLQLSKMGLDRVWTGRDYIEIVTDKIELDKLEAMGFKTEAIYPDLTAYLQSRMPAKAMGAYKTLDEIYTYLDQIIAGYPAIVSARQSIGQTIEGRDIWAVKISDNPGIDEDEPEILYTAAIHAREVITPEVLFYFMDYLTQNYGSDPEVTDLVDNRELWFILVVNPDGYYHNEVIEPNGGGMWRKNRRNNGDGTYGVDLNRNYGYMWGFDNEGSSPNTGDPTYRGTAAFSEPETQALRDFAIAREFVITIYYHSYSNLILWPWGYDQIYCEDEDIFSVIGDSASTFNGYDPGPGWILYVVNGSSDDWHYGEQTLKKKNFSMTIEVGSYEDNFWPPASRIQPLISENLQPNLYFAEIAGHIYSLRAPAAPFAAVDDTVNMDQFEVYWSHDDTLNPAMDFELVELSDRQVITDSINDTDQWNNFDFMLSTDRYASFPSSFYSGEQNNIFRYIQTIDAYSVQPGDTLRFNTYYDIETDWDYAYVEVSLDGETFLPIEGTITTESDPNGNNRGHGITGVSVGGWTEALFDLSDYVGRNVYFRISYYTDQYVTEEGIYIDDFYPHAVFASRIVYDSITDTSYTIVDKTEGEYFFKVRARDTENQWSSYSAIVSTYATEGYICGDANGDGSPDVADAVYMINYVFKNGPAPDPAASGDANADGELNIADGVYMINFVFKGGPEPLCP